MRREPNRSGDFLIPVIHSAKRTISLSNNHHDTADKQTVHNAPVKPSLLKTESSTAAPNEKSSIPSVTSGELVAPKLINKARSGDAKAKFDLISIAADKNAKDIERSVAIQYLARDGNPGSLAIVAAQLSSEKPSIRTTAYYNLPEKLRPIGFDYTASPSPDSRAIVAKLVQQIKQ